MLKPEILLTLKLNDHLFTDPRRIALLKAIEKTGSLSKAAKAIDISYKTAWDAVNEINNLSPQPFLVTTTGGRGGGGSKLSAYAVRFIQLYDLLTQLQYNAFTILNDNNVPLDDILTATAKLSLQTSARNQLYGTVKSINTSQIAGFTTVMLNDNVTKLDAYITKASVERLKLSVEKTVILLIKAPLVELHFKPKQHLQNCFAVTVQTIKQDNKWSDMDFLLPSGLTLYASKPFDEIQQLKLSEGSQLFLSIDPNHIVIATLV